MKRKYINSILACCAVAWGFSACTDAWDEHFQANKPIAGQTGNANENLWELINSDEELTEFAALLQATGYDTLLTKNRSYTVWAPADGSGFIDMSLLEGASEDELAAYKKEVVENHIAHFVHSAGGIRDKEDKKNYEMVEMINLKKYDFEGPQQGAYTFAGKDLSASNIVAKNGMLHKVQGYVAFSANIWEQLAKEPSISKLWAFLKKDFKREFNENQSVQGPVVDGQVTWLDSVFTEDCRWFREIGWLDREDSSYTMYALTDKAWDEMYELTKRYFAYPEDMKILPGKGNLTVEEAADSLVRELMCRNLVFSNTVNEKYYDGLSDTLRSTSFQIFEGDEARALSDASMNGQIDEIPLSNGTLKIVDQVNYNPFTCWHDTLRVEGESLSDADETRLGFKTANKATEFIHRDSLLYDFVSNHAIGIYKAYTGTTNPVFNFYVNNVLSAWYRIKIVMLPPQIVDPLDTLFVKPNKFQARLYRGAGIIKELDGPNFEEERSAYFWTNNTEKVDTIVLAEAIHIPFCEYGYKDLSGDNPGLRLEISSYLNPGTGNRNKKDCFGAKTVANWKYDNDFRIDQVIFEPIEAPEDTPDVPTDEPVGE